jgi:tripartite-type tricarboxylate transporter receptor subunit TctC
MKPHRFAQAALAAFAGAALLLAPALAQIGEKPIRIVFPFASGGSGDALARLIADKMQAARGRTVIVESRTGAAGRLGVREVANSAPDGSTILITPIAPMVVYQHVYNKLDYDPIADFAPLSLVATFDFAIAVPAELAVKSIKELVAWGKANPGKANFGIPAAGSLPHFLGVLFGRAASIDAKAIPYKGSAAALKDVVGGHLPMIVTTTSDLVQMHKAGRIRILATSGKARSPFVPEVKTFLEEGYDLVADSWYGMFAPAKTPPDIVERYNQAIVAAVKSPDVREKLLTHGLQPAGTTAAELGAAQKRDSAFWGPAVKASGFKAQQ